jgi:hypothetical protein
MRMIYSGPTGSVIHQAVPVGEIKVSNLRGSGFTNHCILGQPSKCGVESTSRRLPGWDEHVDCKYAVKSRGSDRCMSFCFDEFCTCLEAQEAKRI